MKYIKILGIALTLFAVCGVGLAKESTIQIGQQVPNFRLVDQSGRDVSMEDFQGKGVIVSFLYTRCPYPDKCPMIGKKLANLAELSEKIGKDNELQVLAVTLDPAHDKPEVLKAYAQGFDEKHKNWLFLTGTEGDIAKVAGAFGVLYWEENGVIEHNMRTAFIDGNGVLQVVKSGSDWKAGVFAAQIKKYLR